MKITATLNAYINTGSSFDLTQFADAMREGDEAEAIDALSLMKFDFGKDSDFAKVGKAYITVEFDGDPRNEILQKSVEALQRKRNAILAEAQRQATEIDARIQSLLAIEHEDGAETA